MKSPSRIFIAVGAAAAAILSVAKPNFTDVFTDFNSGFESVPYMHKWHPALILRTQAEEIDCFLRLKVADAEGNTIARKNDLAFGFHFSTLGAIRVSEDDGDWLHLHKGSDTSPEYFTWQAGASLLAVCLDHRRAPLKLVDWELIPNKKSRDSMKNQWNRAAVNWILRGVSLCAIFGAFIIPLRDDSRLPKIDRVTRDHINDIIRNIKTKVPVETTVCHDLLQTWVNLKMDNSQEHPIHVVDWEKKVSRKKIGPLWYWASRSFRGQLRSFDPMGIFRSLLQ